MQITVAIPTFNSADYIAELLAYVVTQHPYRIYVLDDASTDATVAVCQKFPGVEVIAGEKNVGPTRNRNRVLNKDIGDILVFLDDDMQWRSGDLMAATRKYFADRQLGALGFSIFKQNGQELWFGNQREADPLFFWARNPFSWSPFTPPERHDSYASVCWLMEGAFAIRSDLFKQLGGFDKRFVRYQEGPDLCRRLRDHGHTIGHTNSVGFTHPKPLSVFSPSHLGLYLKTAILYHKLHHGKANTKS
jgi:GT2 family glycosyltransferase